MAMKAQSPLPRILELEPYYQKHFCSIRRTAPFFFGSRRILKSADRWVGLSIGFQCGGNSLPIVCSASFCLLFVLLETVRTANWNGISTEGWCTCIRGKIIGTILWSSCFLGGDVLFELQSTIFHCMDNIKLVPGTIGWIPANILVSGARMI